MYPSKGRHNTDLSTSSSGSRYSQESQDSRSTAPTSIHSNPGAVFSKNAYEMSPATTYCARSSSETYASTIASQEEISEGPDTYDPEYEVPEYREVVETDLHPTNPSNFADYFPSANRLYIRHDDTAYDGNMNLRVDTEASGREKGNVQLFHLRMHDLKKREFSLRRYERSSGREVCHSSRKYTKSAADQRPAFTRSMSNAFANIRRPDLRNTKSGLSTHGPKSRKGVKRQDSGYASNEEEDEDEVEEFIAEQKSNGLPIPTNTTKLEFSNYSQVLVKRRGKKSSSKRYEFEYWGHIYTWKRVVEKDGRSTHAVAHIVPEMRSPSQIRAEDAAGGWVPPCSMWISDHSVLEALTDVADVVVATGLIALVDDCIKHHFHSKKHSHQVSLPLTPLKYEMEFVSPKAMVQHIFKRKNSSTSEGKRSPLSQTSFGAAC
ncbi:hypothetical protein LSUB1_G004234 [Lachnellula subtilissima]|uniref:Uncharacterized protein n=1 Tax=Lachnellula subtilissima TaxID=602034 RepID=A0A8H8RK96_9HELO|nr:hypothetical protein LSUB1_G004234 [Lachnellula subtilissima]